MDCNRHQSTYLRISNQGMTMIELLVTMALAALLFAVGVPGFNSLRASQTQTAQSNNYNGLIQFARSLATAEAKNITLCASQNNLTCGEGTNLAKGAVIISTAANGDQTLVRVIDPVDKSDFEITLLGFPTTNRIDFTDTGEVKDLATSASILLCDNRGAQFGNALIINPLGIVRRATDDDNDKIVNQHDQTNLVCSS